MRRLLTTVVAGVVGCASAAMFVSSPAAGALAVWGDETVAVTDLYVVGTLADRTQTSGSSVSSTGRYVVLESPIPLVDADTNNVNDVYRRDMTSGEIVLVSRADGGSSAAGTQPSTGASISADGNRVAFLSEADNLAPTDTDEALDVFVRIIDAERTHHISVGSGGSDPDGRSTNASISASGQFVVFASGSDNLLSGPVTPTPGQAIYLRDLSSPSTTLVSVDRDGEISQDQSGYASVSEDGRWVVFQSAATNLVARDNNGTALDTFVRDMNRGDVDRLAVLPTGGQPHEGSRHPVVSADGQFAAFASRSKDLVAGDHDALDVFRVRLATRRVVRLSQDVFGPGVHTSSTRPSLSADGMIASFLSVETSLPDAVPQPDVWVRRVPAGVTALASVDNAGDPTGQECWSTSVSGNGRAVAFTVEDGTLGEVPITVHALNIYLRLNPR